MDDGAGVHVGETPHTSINSSGGRSCHESGDSGYLSLTSHFGYTPIVTTGYRSKLSGVSAKRQRNRLDPWQNEKPQKHRSKLNKLLNLSESNYSITESIEHDSGLESSCANQSVSFVAHSTPSCANNELGEDFVSKDRRNWKSTRPFTPVFKDLQLCVLSPPPSPAIFTASYVASESIEKDVEMKMTVPQENTQQNATLSQHEVSGSRIVISPIRRNHIPVVTSAENQQLSKLSITDLCVIPEIKPKRLDFSHRGLTELWCTSASSDYARKEKVDFLSLLGKERNLSHLVSRILFYLEPQDLCSVSMVSTTWKRICKNDSCANKRRITHILCKQNFKENIKMVKKIVKHEEDTQASSRSKCYARKGYLQNVQNLLHVPLQSRPPNSPPVSPSKVKFHSFVKASRTLAHGEYLLPCPRCTFPSHVDSEKNVGTCTRQGCSIEFCSSCSSKPHIGPCKTPLLATPTKRNKRLIVGSRQSKRNLRRL